MEAVFFLLIGLAVLILGSEWLVTYSTQLGLKLGVSPLIIGLSFVAFGSSAPEIAVSIQSSLMGYGMIAVSNVVGSNMFNILIILGVSSLIAPVLIPKRVLLVDVPIMVGATLLFYVFTKDGVLRTEEGVFLGIALLGYLYYLFYQFKKSPNEANETIKSVIKPAKPVWVISVMIFFGISMILWSSREIVLSTISIAAWLGLSQTAIGLTVIAIGTSMPEFVTSLIAMFRGQNEMAIGNIIGSNILNILAVIGLSSLVHFDSIILKENLVRFDIPAMTIVALMCLPVFFTGNKIQKWEGILFICYYISYMGIRMVIALNATSLLWVQDFFMSYLVPITFVVLIAHSLYSLISWRKGLKKLKEKLIQD